jgi:hypothetical protein
MRRMDEGSVDVLAGEVSHRTRLEETRRANAAKTRNVALNCEKSAEAIATGKEGRAAWKLQYRLGNAEHASCSASKRRHIGVMNTFEKTNRRAIKTTLNYCLLYVRNYRILGLHNTYYRTKKWALYLSNSAHFHCGYTLKAKRSSKITPLFARPLKDVIRPVYWRRYRQIIEPFLINQAFLRFRCNSASDFADNFRLPFLGSGRSFYWTAVLVKFRGLVFGVTGAG